MACSKHVTTKEYLEGCRAFVSGQQNLSPYGDKTRSIRWDYGFEEMGKCKVAQETRKRNQAAK